MISAVPETTTGRIGRISDRPDRNSGCLRSDIASAYELSYGRRPRVDQLDGLEDVGGYILRVRLFEASTQVHRTWAQMARGIGWVSTGTVKGDIQRYRNSIARRLDVLVEIGWLRDWTPVYKADGESVGILVTFTPAGVAQSVDPAAYRGRRQPRLREKSGECQHPSDHQQRRAQASVVSRRRQACARARTRALRADRRAHEQRCRQRGAALEELRSRASTGGLEALRRAAADGADPLAVAIAGWEAIAPRHPRLTRKRWEHLERYCRIADRLGQPGMGCWVLLGELERQAHAVASGEIGSLDFFVCHLRREVRAARRQWRRARRLTELRATFDQMRGLA